METSAERKGKSLENTLLEISIFDPSKNLRATVNIPIFAWAFLFETISIFG